MKKSELKENLNKFGVDTFGRYSERSGYVFNCTTFDAKIFFYIDRENKKVAAIDYNEQSDCGHKMTAIDSRDNEVLYNQFLNIANIVDEIDAEIAKEEISNAFYFVD